VSSAAILLKTIDQIVGVMLIGYRRHHEFPKDERENIIKTLAFSAAIAIQNQRWLSILHEIDRKIITTLELNEVLELIIQKARQITLADLADVRLFEDPISEELVMKVWYPPDESAPPSMRLKIGVGITGHVAKDRRPILSNDVQHDSRYIACFNRSGSGSELCVPLLENHRVLGVLNLESYQTGAFEDGHIDMLTTLAGQAVIAIQNHENKQKLIAAEKIATIDDMASSLVHQMNNDFGAIEFYVDDILRDGDKYSQSVAINIKSIVEKVFENTERLRNWVPERLIHINIFEAVNHARKRINFPENITQEIEIPKNFSPVSGSKKGLSEIFYNLIQNAVDAMPDGGELIIRGQEIKREEQCWIEVEVSDTGQGIAKEDYEKIFQLDYSTKVGHQGFGLWWTRAYIQRLGGSIFVDSQFSNGAKFIVIIPVASQDNT
jgi:signal transduction histidine kinase